MASRRWAFWFWLIWRQFDIKRKNKNHAEAWFLRRTV